MTRIAIDLNVRVRGNATYAGFEDVSGPLAIDQDVIVYEPESGLSGNGHVTEIDAGRELVYLSVDWASMSAERPPAAPPAPADTVIWTAHENALILSGNFLLMEPRPTLHAALVSWAHSSRWSALHYEGTETDACPWGSQISNAPACH